MYSLVHASQAPHKLLHVHFVSHGFESAAHQPLHPPLAAVVVGESGAAAGPVDVVVVEIVEVESKVKVAKRHKKIG